MSFAASAALPNVINDAGESRDFVALATRFEESNPPTFSVLIIIFCGSALAAVRNVFNIAHLTSKQIPTAG